LFTNRLFRLIIPTTLVLVLGIASLIGCTPDHPMSTFDAKGPVADRQLSLFVMIFWIAIAVFIVVGGGLLYTVIRFRDKGDGFKPEQTHGNTKLEITWTVIPSIMLALVAIPTVVGQFYISSPPNGEDMQINVEANQWWWEIEYPESGVVTANEIHVPLGKAVGVYLTSPDVLHSFWVPKLAGKMDIVPGKTTYMWFQGDEIGNYYGQCAEFCGESHAYMRFRVIVESQEDFDNWQQSQFADATPPNSDQEKLGATLFITKGCIACHTVKGVPAAAGIIGPSLTHVGSRGTLAGGIIDMTEENLSKWLKNPNKLKPGNIMSKQGIAYTNDALALQSEDISNLVAYLQALK
jgi:cytochrome c oxidase subunit 2